MSDQALTRQARDTLVAAVMQWKPYIEKMLPKHLSPEKMIKVINLALTRQPELWSCTTNSVVQAILTASQLGLDVGGPLGSAYLVPYKDKSKGITICTLIVGYRGLIDLARRSGQIQTIEAHVALAGEEFDVAYGSEPHLIHKPMIVGEPGEVLGAYAVAHLRGGAKQIEFMTKRQIDAIRGNKSFGPWKDHYEEMCRKTAVRRICKYLPLSAELAQALRADDNADMGQAPDMDFDVDAIDVIPEKEKEPTSAQGQIAKKASEVRAQQAQEENVRLGPCVGCGEPTVRRVLDKPLCVSCDQKAPEQGSEG